MTPRFIMPAGYKSRVVELVLTRAGKGWKFYGRCDGYTVPALNAHKLPLCGGVPFDTRADAARMARALDLPAYAIWNGRTRSYDGEGAKFLAVARDALEVI